MSVHDINTEDLLARASLGDRSAVGRLLEQHRRRLRQFIATRLDRRLATRVDPSDVVQDALADAGRRLPEFLRDRAVGFVPWLRNLAIQRLISVRRFHLWSFKRSAQREVFQDPTPSGLVVDQLAGSGTSPSGYLIREEERQRVRTAVEVLSLSDREILNLRYVEDLSFAEIAERLQLGLSAVKIRHLRAIEHFRSAIDEIGVGAAVR